MILESTQHEFNSFITLTYTDEEVIKTGGNLEPRHVQLFLKRLRRRLGKFRFFCAGEYGDQTLRPHYHLALFGVMTCLRGQTDLRKAECCAQCQLISSCWERGAVQVARLEPASAAYIAGYVTKKRDANSGIKNLRPPFHRMSLKPGLGLHAMHDVAAVLLSHDLHKTISDVPVILQHGTERMPLGRYLRRNLRKMIGREENAPESTLETAQEELRALREIAWLNKEKVSETLALHQKGRIQSFYAKEKIRNRRK